MKPLSERQLGEHARTLAVALVLIGAAILANLSGENARLMTNTARGDASELQIGGEEYQPLDIGMVDPSGSSCLLPGPCSATTEQ